MSNHEWVIQTKKGDVIGRGREAEVLFWESEKVIKLYNKEIPEERIRTEYDNNYLPN